MHCIARMLAASAAIWAVAGTAEARFLQTDPVGYKDDLNPYQYARNDPVNLLDPNGREVQRREWSLNLGVITISRGDYVASEAGEPLRTGQFGGDSNVVERGEYSSFGVIIGGLSLGVERGQYSCLDCGPADIEGKSAMFAVDLGVGVSQGRNQSEGESLPGVGYVEQYEGPETTGVSLGVSVGVAPMQVQDTTVEERRPIPAQPREEERR